MKKTTTPSETWKRKAMAFAVRSHRHLWGKNNEDPLIFLYHRGLNHEFSKQIYLGWNKFGQERPYKGWGISKPGTFFIPPGIVFPHIVDQELLSIYILPMDTAPGYFILPGSAPGPVILGDPDNGTTYETQDFFQGLFHFQEDSDKACVTITPA
ncbi:MAG: hypothetical protein HUK40_09685 [Desulfobacter sp.]|nr:hypothetical protein [Desulfobacter sp.]WDP84347.1 MAG: hypothetical protein HUN05_03570 [Desulfobacter sp.]